MEGVCAFCVDTLKLFSLFDSLERMTMIFRKKNISKGSKVVSFDSEKYKPVLKCSICNGERVAGFKNLQTGKFEEIALIRNDTELEEFKEKYGISQISKEY